MKKTNIEKPDNKLHRVVLTLWHFNHSKPTVGNIGTFYASNDDAFEAIASSVKQELEDLNGLKTTHPRAKVPIEDSDGNIVGYDYPFRSDEDGDHANIIRFWDGDDYRNVAAYDVYELVFGPCGLVNSASWYKYRGYVILVDRDRKCFGIEAGPGVVPVVCESLEDALALIDENLLIGTAERVAQLAFWDGTTGSLKSTPADDLVATISEILHRIGITSNVKGHRYLRSAIYLTVKNPQVISSAMKVLYPAVAKEYSTTPHKVERDIYYAIKIAWERGNQDIINAYFGSSLNRRKPSNTQFIATIADSLLLRNFMK